MLRASRSRRQTQFWSPPNPSASTATPRAPDANAESSPSVLHLSCREIHDGNETLTNTHGAQGSRDRAPRRDGARGAPPPAAPLPRRRFASWLSCWAEFTQSERACLIPFALFANGAPMPEAPACTDALHDSRTLSRRRSGAGVSPLSRTWTSRSRRPALRVQLGHRRFARVLPGDGVRRQEPDRRVD